ncbi:hypothetical protein ACWDU8_05405 [Streptomyces sp. NPDC003388]|uniref:hypothetical protein n=1 Tax=Streptomyces sp. ATE26 TaxID=2954237 RepID=UPI0024830C10|nr:hypothetical protein [Streptomyces sp. ATE26]MDI1453127.1 hypothetical protein [Streptomyces sp. ATE26]
MSDRHLPGKLSAIEPASATTAISGYRGTVIFFSNRIGCLGSLLISAVATFILFMIFAH